MVAGAYGLTGDWSRINVFLPANDALELLAAQQAIQVVRNLYGGATWSLVRPHVLEGYWWDDVNGMWVRDKICWLIADAPYSLGRDELDVDVELIKLEVFDVYNYFGRQQLAIWIIVHPAWKAL